MHLSRHRFQLEGPWAPCGQVMAGVPTSPSSGQAAISSQLRHHRLDANHSRAALAGPSEELSTGCAGAIVGGRR